jgi:Skp family chaperone for outer membrane proteins
VANEPDERKRYRQAFANMKRFFPTAGVDKARILSAIDHYRRVMVAEGEDAKEDLKRKIQTEVTASKEKIAAEEEELNKRQELINLEREKLEQRKRAVVEREEALEKKSKNFLKTLEYLIGILDSDRKKLDEYLND